MLVRPVATLALVLLPSVALAQNAHDVTAQSTAHVETKADGVIEMRVRNTRLVPYTIYEGDRHKVRLATIASDVRTSTAAEGVDPASTVAVTVDDLSAPAARRLSAYSDPGAAGEVFAGYSVATLPGCCEGPDVHRVRHMDSGRLLFRSTGPAPMGSAAWAEAPNAKPRTVRWAALDCVTDDKEVARRLVGRLAYGSDAGKLASVDIVLKGEGSYDETWLPLAHDAQLQWIDTKAGDDTGGPSSGTADDPKPIWAIDGVADAARLGGFKIAVVTEGKRLVVIPVSADRLDLGAATVADGLSLSPTP
jgi:hypothetical protein